MRHWVSVKAFFLVNIFFIFDLCKIYAKTFH